MARKIIIQDRISEPSDFSFRYVFWAAVPSTRQAYYADANKTSAVKDATGPEVTALQTGAVLEQQGQVQYPASMLAQDMQADLIARFNVYQAQVTAANPGVFYGTFWDGTAWTFKVMA